MEIKEQFMKKLNELKILVCKVYLSAHFVSLSLKAGYLFRGSRSEEGGWGERQKQGLQGHRRGRQ